MLLLFGGSDKWREAREGQRGKKEQSRRDHTWVGACHQMKVSSDWRHVERSAIKSRVLEKRSKGQFAISQTCTSELTELFV